MGAGGTNKTRAGLSHSAVVHILTLRERIYERVTQLLKKRRLTEPQYNVLRILRGAGPEGLPILEVGRRMITRIPDVSRLLDRMETAKLVTRARCLVDRRIVRTCITARGLKLLKELDPHIDEFQHSCTESLNKKELEQLVMLVSRVSNDYTSQ